jgi:hypothetical protein
MCQSHKEETAKATLSGFETDESLLFGCLSLSIFNLFRLAVHVNNIIIMAESL